MESRKKPADFLAEYVLGDMAISDLRPPIKNIALKHRL
jgi:hypothetical protein